MELQKFDQHCSDSRYSPNQACGNGHRIPKSLAGHLSSLSVQLALLGHELDDLHMNLFQLRLFHGEVLHDECVSTPVEARARHVAV